MHASFCENANPNTDHDRLLNINLNKGRAKGTFLFILCIFHECFELSVHASFWQNANPITDRLINTNLNKGKVQHKAKSIREAAKKYYFLNGLANKLGVGG